MIFVYELIIGATRASERGQKCKGSALSSSTLPRPFPAARQRLLGDNILRVLALSFANFGVYCFANDFPLSQDPSNEVG